MHGWCRMKNPKQKLLNGIATTAVVFSVACSPTPEQDDVEKQDSPPCPTETKSECPEDDPIRKLRDSLLKGEKIKKSDRDSDNSLMAIEPE